MRMIFRDAPLATATAVLYAASSDSASSQIDKLIPKIEQHEGFNPADTTVETEAVFIARNC